MNQLNLTAIISYHLPSASTAVGASVMCSSSTHWHHSAGCWAAWGLVHFPGWLGDPILSYCNSLQLPESWATTLEMSVSSRGKAAV